MASHDASDAKRIDDRKVNMNARSVRKRLMKHRHDGRAFLCVRIPLVSLSAPPARPKFPGFVEFADGCWRNRDTKELIEIQQITTPNLPEWEDGQCLFFVRNKPDSSWVEYWEGYIYSHDDDGNSIRDILPEEDVAAERSFQEWYDRLRSSHPLTKALSQAGWSSMDIQFSEDMKYAFFQFRVKWFYPNTKRTFCSAISRALKMAKSMKIEARLMKGCYS